jgi:lipoprotein-releasing system permease protein
MAIEFFISRRYFKSKPKQAIIALITLFSMCGITIGVTALIVVIGVMAGFEQDLKTRIMGIEPHILIDRPSHGPSNEIEGYPDAMRKIEHIQGVKSIWPVVELQAMLSTDSRSVGALIKGVDPNAAARALNLPILEVLQRREEQPAGPSTIPLIVLGRDLARNLGLIEGDTLFVVSPRGTLTPAGFVPLMKRFLVAGFFETGMYEYDGSLAFTDLKNAQTLARIQDAVSSLEVRLDRIFESDTVASQVRGMLGKTFRVRDWRQMNKNLFSALKLEKAAMFITLTLIILVATFSIISSLIMMVMEKTRDIAVLRALGATRRIIGRIFIFQGMLIGTIGTVCGVAIGTLLCYAQMTYQWVHLPGDVYYITILPVKLNIIDVVLVASAALLICFGASLYPAVQASRLNPVEAIRYG